MVALLWVLYVFEVMTPMSVQIPKWVACEQVFEFFFSAEPVLNVIFWPILKGENILLGRPSQFTTKFTLIMNFCVVFYGKYRMDFLVGDFNAS